MIEVRNYMNGISYKLTPVDTLRMVCASCIRGEPMYYVSGENEIKEKTCKNKTYKVIQDYLIFPNFNNYNSTKLFDTVLQNALKYNIDETIEVIKDCRKEYMMRNNPQIMAMQLVLFTRGTKYNEQNPNKVKDMINQIIQRPDDMYKQFEYYKEVNGSKNSLPGLVKRSWSKWLEENLTRYNAKKYLNKGHILDMIRVSHPRSSKNGIISELVETGDVKIKESEQTWENLKSGGKSWDEILKTIKIPHMALLRNLRGIFTEIKKITTARSVMKQLLDGVPGGKQFPFRYWSAYTEVKIAELTNDKVKNIILSGLEDCLQKSIENFPSLDGDTVSLCDNSGSAWGTFNSTYGSVTVATIANLSGLITAYCCKGVGKIGLFGDRLCMYTVNKKKPLLKQLDEINDNGKKAGRGTENGIWLFFNKSIRDINVYDNIFIYSDMQAGYGKLYGKNSNNYIKYSVNGSYIDVLSLLNKYRMDINGKVNFFSIQVAGYDNNVIPDNIYRGAIMQGWTGKEVCYSQELINIWNSIENGVNSSKQKRYINKQTEKIKKKNYYKNRNKERKQGLLERVKNNIPSLV